MKIAHGIPWTDAAQADFIRLAYDRAGLHASAREPHREAMRIVIAPVTALRHREASKLRAPDNQCRIEQASLFQVLQQSCDRLVRHAAHFLVIADQILVCIPLDGDRAAAGIELDKTHTALHQTASEQAS